MYLQRQPLASFLYDFYFFVAWFVLNFCFGIQYIEL